jgi:hypothetical protein
MDDRYRVLSEFAARHHGLFRVSDLDGLGLSERQLRWLVGTGACERVVRGVYRVRGAPVTADQALLALVWLHPEPVLASHSSAARLLGFPGFGHARPEVVLIQGRSRRGGGGQVHGTLVLPASHRTVRNGIPCTSVERTLFDLAGVVPARRAAALVDLALQRGWCSTRSLQSTFFGLARRGRPGTATMRRMLEERTDQVVVPASELERRARKLFAEAGLPMPECEVALGDDAWIGRVDCLWRAQRVIVELDGRAFHGGATAREADRLRDNRLMAAGWRVLRFTWDDICDRPAEVVRILGDALGIVFH